MKFTGMGRLRIGHMNDVIGPREYGAGAYRRRHTSLHYMSEPKAHGASQMSHFSPPCLGTSRLLLTWPTKEQIDGYYAAIIGTKIFDTIYWDGPSGPQELHDWWKESASRDPSDLSLHLDTAVIERASGRYIGGVTLRPVEGDPAIVDIGYAFAVDSHGKGYATEAVGALEFGHHAPGQPADSHGCVRAHYRSGRPQGGEQPAAAALTAPTGMGEFPSRPCTVACLFSS